MKAIIIAGGKGERLKPMTDVLPKPMIGVRGQPILLHTIDLFKKHNIIDLIIALCYLPEEIIKFFGDGSKFGVKITYTHEDPNKPLGTAGAITLARNLLNETFIVTSGDILRNLNITEMINFHRENQAFATLNVYKRPSNGAKSKVVIESNRIVNFIERPDQNDLNENLIWSNGSFYIFQPEIFNFLKDSKKVDFGSDIFPKIVTRKKVLAFPTTGYFVDIGDHEKLEYARKTFKVT